MTSIFLHSTQALGEFLIGASYDTWDATVAGMASIPGQVRAASKYALGVDRVVGENRPWSQLGTGYRGDFWAGDNGPTRLAERFNHTVFSIALGAVNTLGGGLPYTLVNQKMGIACPYFFPGPTNARELGRFFASGVAMMMTGRQLLVASEVRVIVPTTLAMDPVPVIPPIPRIVHQGPVRLQYALPSAIETVATHIRRGNVVAPSVLKRMLDVRHAELVGPAARATIELVREGHLPTHLLEGILWDTHPRTAHLFHHLYDMRAGSPRLNALWNHLGLDAYEIEVFANGDTQLRPIYTPLQAAPTPRLSAPAGAAHYN